MLVIRKEQLKVFEAEAERAFAAHLIEHIAGFAPELFGVAGESGVHAFVHIGLERAERYGLTNRGPIRFYIELMCSLGIDFDTDPQLPWARDILNGTSDQTSRADELFASSARYFEEVIGPDDAFAVRAIRQFLQVGLTKFQTESPGCEDEILWMMDWIYPEKFSHTGDAALRRLLARCSASGRSLGLTDNFGTALLGTLMYAFGHGVLDDPLYPWVAKTLRDEQIANPADRAERLYRKTLVYFSRVASTLGEGSTYA